MMLGSAVTVTVSPASVTVSSSTVGPGASQNQETAPVSPRPGEMSESGRARAAADRRPRRQAQWGRRPVRPGRRACSRARACRVRMGRHDPAGGVPELPGPSGSGFWAKDESSRSGGYRIGAVDVSRTPRPPDFPITARRLLPSPHRGADTGPGSVVLLRVAADRDDGRPGSRGGFRTSAAALVASASGATALRTTSAARVSRGRAPSRRRTGRTRRAGVAPCPPARRA